MIGPKAFESAALHTFSTWQLVDRFTGPLGVFGEDPKALLQEYMTDDDRIVFIPPVDLITHLPTFWVSTSSGDLDIYATPVPLRTLQKIKDEMPRSFMDKRPTFGG